MSVPIVSEGDSHPGGVWRVQSWGAGKELAGQRVIPGWELGGGWAAQRLVARTLGGAEAGAAFPIWMQLCPCLTLKEPATSHRGAGGPLPHWDHSLPCSSIKMGLRGQKLLVAPVATGPTLVQLFCSRIFIFNVDYFKVFIEFVTKLSLLHVFWVFWSQGMWEPRSPTKDQTRTTCIGRWSPQPLDC